MSDFDNIAVGDIVCVPKTDGFNNRLVGLDMGPVEKVTATQITALGRRWIKRSGLEVGASSWYQHRLMLVTDELRERAKAGAAASKAERILYRVVEILKKARDDEAVRLAALLPDELTEPPK